MTAAMLGRHPEFLALPEQNLFLADTLGQLSEIEQSLGSQRGYLAGLKRAIAYLEFGGESESALEQTSVWIQRRWFWSSARAFHYLQRKAAPLALVYKSPRATMARHSMKRMLAAAPNARYLHLVREPGDAVRDWALTASNKQADANRFFAEIWIHCQQMILDAQTSMPGTMLRIRGEDVVNHPAESMHRITQWLGISADDDILERMRHPEAWPFARILPALEGEDNDLGFLQQPTLRPTPEPSLSVNRLGLDQELTEKLERFGRMFGYQS